MQNIDARRLQVHAGGGSDEMTRFGDVLLQLRKVNGGERAIAIRTSFLLLRFHEGHQLHQNK